uniref:Uncharacterized protein n=1 Tax=Strigamia maritima TaxID=126957 RepID=T1J9I8_STRMM
MASSVHPYCTAVAKTCTNPAPKHEKREKSEQIQPAMECSLDMNRLTVAMRRLHASGFYYEGLALVDAAQLLQSKPVGTFLIRDSTDPRYLFSLSVQTERGPTNVRIHYLHGNFRLDAEANLFETMPVFECVLSLVDYYVHLSATDKARNHVWLDQSGRRDLHIRLCRPLYRHVASLQHLCRTTLAKCVSQQQFGQLPVPQSLTSFLRDYPYSQ